MNGLVLDVSGYGIDPVTGNLLVLGTDGVLRPITGADLWPLVKTRAQGVVGAWRDNPLDATVTETLVVHPSVEQASDGDDYIEGNGGRDTIFGNLGQDDIVGDSSDLYGLGDNQTVTIARRVAGRTTFYTSTAGAAPWRVTGLSADGRTLFLSGSATNLLAGVHEITVYGAGIQEPLTVTIASPPAASASSPPSTGAPSAPSAWARSAARPMPT